MTGTPSVGIPPAEYDCPSCNKPRGLNPCEHCGHDADTLAGARRWINDRISTLFGAEIANEDAMRREAERKDRPDEEPPPATLRSAIDSVAQGGLDTFGLLPEDGVALAYMAALAGGDTELRDLL